MPFSPQTLARLRDTVDTACADAHTGIPGATVVIIGQDGKELFAHSAGKEGVSSPLPMTLDNIFWIASSTKLLTGIAVMQLVEQGILRLDDGAQVESLCPELKDMQVLRPDGQLEDKKTAITLRMLLTHTSGFGYSFFNERLRDWALPVGLDEFSARIEDITVPLLFQPGTAWEYGAGIDWAGVVLERATKLTLNAYLQQKMLTPLGIENTSMIPRQEMRARLAHMHTRDKDGVLRPRDHLLRAPLVVDPYNEAEVARIFNSGGAGMFSKPQEYAHILSVLLNNGTCPRTHTTLLQHATVDEMFRNQIAAFPDFARQRIPAAKPDLTNEIGELYPVPGNPPQGWGLTFMLSNGGATGRSAGTAHWAGLANVWWWCDREKGVAGIVCTQILPFADAKVLELWAGVEAQVYEALAAGE